MDTTDFRESLLNHAESLLTGWEEKQLTNGQKSYNLAIFDALIARVDDFPDDQAAI
jgi:hypothetical protein